ncbi:MAG: hypothetical protein CMJ78_10290 [Planctomycetaceae bacterium]|nr:hypothetical protein [Planctomycetaceae bacterium]
MSISSLPLSYCTNVHAAQTVAAVINGLDQYTVKVQERLGQPVATGLWLARSVASELLAADDSLKQFADELRSRELICYTLNTFPYGDFHSERVKETVYIPGWSEPSRSEYTLDSAKILSELLPDGTEGSLSTVPLGFKEREYPADFDSQCIESLISLAVDLDELHSDTGKMIRLAIEPEPICVLETTDETIQFFNRLRSRAADSGTLEQVNRHIGVCYDVCHQSVEFEDVAASIESLRQAEIRINKLHITCAIDLEDPANNAEARDALATFVESRYLHQTFGRRPDGTTIRVVDLDQDLALSPPPEFLECDRWRIHFHVPVNAESLGPLNTTRPDLKRALAAVAALDYAPHLEVETYTWGVLPSQQVDLVEGLTNEMRATHELLSS